MQVEELSHSIAAATPGGIHPFASEEELWGAWQGCCERVWMMEQGKCGGVKMLGEI